MNCKHLILRPLFLLISLLLMLIACAPVEEQNGVASAEPSPYAAETVFKNSAIYTVNPNQPWVDAVAVKDGVIVAAGMENPAYSLHQDDTTGTIEVGKQADLVVIDQNLFEVAPTALSDTNVLITMLAGEEVYRADGAPAAVPLTVSVKEIDAHR